MEIEEQAEAYVFDYLNDVQLQSTEYISTGGTLDNLLNDGWTPTEIVNGEADCFINDAIVWLD